MSDAVSGATYALSGQTSKQYIRVVVTLDDQACGTTSTMSDLTVNYSLPPGVLTLVFPASGQTNVSAIPELRFYATDPQDDYLRYKVEVCSTSDYSSIVRTIDQTSGGVRACRAQQPMRVARWRYISTNPPLCRQVLSAGGGHILSIQLVRMYLVQHH